MNGIPLKIKLGLVAFGYVGVALMATALVILRQWQYATHEADAAAYGGMWAGGDLMLEWFIVGMVLAVTFVLVLVIRGYETPYTSYAKALVGVSLTAPLSVAVISIPWVGNRNSIVGYACMYRLFAVPMVAFGMGMSRVFAQFPRAKKLTVYATLIESLTLVGMGVLMFFSR